MNSIWKEWFKQAIWESWIKRLDKEEEKAYSKWGDFMDTESDVTLEQTQELLRLIANEKIVILSDDGRTVGFMLSEYKPDDESIPKKSGKDKNYYISFIPECYVEGGEIYITAHLHANLGTIIKRDNMVIETRITPFDINGLQIDPDRIEYELFAGKDQSQQSILLTIYDEDDCEYQKQLEVDCETGEWEKENKFCEEWESSGYDDDANDDDY